MRIMVLALGLLFAGGCTKLSGGLKSECDPTEAVGASPEENTWTTVTFVAQVTDMWEQQLGRGSIETSFVEEYEFGRHWFVVYLDVLTVEPETYWFRTGENSDFAIHHPGKWFGTDQVEEIRGQHYQFEMSIAAKLLEGMERRMTLISVTPTNSLQAAGADIEN